MDVYMTMRKRPDGGSCEEFLNEMNEYFATKKNLNAEVRVAEYYTVHGKSGDYKVAMIALLQLDGNYKLLYVPGLCEEDIDDEELENIHIEMMTLTVRAFSAMNDIMDMAVKHCRTNFAWRPENALRQVTSG